MAKELVPILLSCIVWRPQLTKQPVSILCDNLSLVNAINKGSSKDLMVMQHLRSLWFFTAYFDILLVASPGKHWTCLNSLKPRNAITQKVPYQPLNDPIYLTGLKHYTTLCSQAKLKPMPTTEVILLFVTHLASHNLACTTIKVYLAAVCSAHVAVGKHKIFKEQLTPRLLQVMKGIHKQTAIYNPPRVCLPITTEILKKIRSILSKEPNNCFNKMM